MKTKIMTHVVAGYPTRDACMKLLKDMQNAGVYAVEVQIPFSDPGADGEVIMMANDIALQKGMTTVGAFKMISEVRQDGLSIPLYVMTYLNKPFSYGLKKFCDDAHKAGVTGLIIPDMPPNTKEHHEITMYCKKLKLELVPVLSPAMMRDSLEAYNLKDAEIVYLTSTEGITGKKFNADISLEPVTSYIRSLSTCQIALGFGIRSVEDVRNALQVADIAVIGSEVMRIINQKGASQVKRFIKNILHQIKITNTPEKKLIETNE